MVWLGLELGASAHQPEHGEVVGGGDDEGDLWVGKEGVRGQPPAPQPNSSALQSPPALSGHCRVVSVVYSKRRAGERQDTVLWQEDLSLVVS